MKQKLYDELKKQKLYDEIKKLNIAGFRKGKIKGSSWNCPCIVQVLTSSDYEDGSLENLQEKIEDFWTNYTNGDLKIIRAAIVKAFEQK